MSTTKRDAMRSSANMYLSLAHGGYDTNNTQPYVIPNNVYVVYASKASRYLMDSMMDDDFYRYFGSVPLIKKSIKDARSWKPEVLRGMFQRVYGPGDVIADINLTYKDTNWPGMGIHKLPIQPIDMTGPSGGIFSGRTMNISDVLSVLRFRTPTILFFVNCRGTTGLSTYYQRQNINYNFGGSTLENYLIVHNRISSRMTKRRREENTLRRRNNIRPAKRQRLSNQH